MVLTGDNSREALRTTLSVHEQQDIAAQGRILVRYEEHRGDSGYHADDKSEGWVAWDNTTGDCWVEGFQTAEQAERFARRTE